MASPIRVRVQELLAAACALFASALAPAVTSGASAAVVEGWIRGPAGPFWASYEWIDGVPVFQGDMLVEPVPSAQATVAQGYDLWEDGVVPFVVHPDLPEPGRVYDAIEHFHAQTEIRLVPWSGEADYVVFEPSLDECRSPVGRGSGGNVIILADDCSWGSVVHEIGHVIGLWHEQSRSDRDEYIEVLVENILTDKVDNFKPYPFLKGFDYGPYDYGSIMHYGSDYFSSNGQDTIVPLYALAPGIVLGQRQALSAGDRDGIGALYAFVSRAESDDRYGSALATGDFDGNGVEDLAVGAPYEDVGSRGNAGSVMVIYGGSAGLVASSQETWTVDNVGTVGQGFLGIASAANDLFGAALAAGDFDGDSYVDLAISAPNRDVGSVIDAGAVFVMRGSFQGLQKGSTRVWTQGAQAGDALEPGDSFGARLAVGDFDGNSTPDLAIGVPLEDIGTIRDAGAVHVLFGSDHGLGAGVTSFWRQGAAGIADSAEAYDQFGATLAAGDFDGNGSDDLVVGVPREDLSTTAGAAPDAGLVHVVYGAPGGLRTSGGEAIHQDVAGVNGVVEANDRFGWSLAAGNFNGGLYDDLAIGAPYEDLTTSAGAQVDAGYVNVQRGSAAGLVPCSGEGLDQNVAGVAGTVEPYDLFGYSLAAGNFDANGYADLAIGVPSEDLVTSGGAIADAGFVNVQFGTATTLSALVGDSVDQDRAGITDTPDVGDSFGAFLATGGLDGDRAGDVVIGVPFEDFPGTTGTATNGGVVHVVRGLDPTTSIGTGLTTAPRLTSTGSGYWHQDR